MIFEYEGDTYKVGSKMFPLSDRDNAIIFTSDNTEDISIPELSKAMDQAPFRAGFCYQNAEIVFQIGKALGLDIHYYAGWMFPSTSYPIHHAWCVLDGNVIDPSINKNELTLIKKLFADGANVPRQVLADAIKKERRKNIPVSEYCMMGKVIDGHKYIGSVDTMETAAERYRQLASKYPDHLSYKNKSSMLGQSPLQMLLNR